MTAQMRSGGGNYRADVDGLRAIAVLAVILFHLKVPGFGGGFVGVDVFFVISGYLITGLVQSEIAKGTFTIKNFYLRRIRRLLPALVAMSIPVAVAAMIVLYPEDTRSYAVSLATQFVSMQNVWFLIDGEYFRGSDTKFLLHTWSLAVEEQFYVFWPLLLLLSRKWRVGTRLGLIALIIVGSFFANLVLMRISPKASFFLLPPRAWELGAGGVLALLEQRGTFAKLGAGARGVIATLGLLAIAGSVGLFTSTTPFPGKAAVLPVLGTVLVILGGIGDDPPAVTRVLAHRVLVRVGLISYPLYLWHWPLMVLALRLELDPSRASGVIAILAITLLLSDLTYSFVETPIRDRKWLSSPRALVLAAAACALPLTLFGIHTYSSNGAAYRFAEPGRSFLVAPFNATIDRCGTVFRIMHPSAAICTLRSVPGAKQRVLLWGNSHADMWTGMLRELAEKAQADLLLNVRNCRATPDNEFCTLALQEAILAAAEREKVTDVILASSWHGQYDVPDEVLDREITRLVKILSERQMRTWLVVDVPDSPELDPVMTFRKQPSAPAFGRVPLSTYDPHRLKERALFTSLAQSMSDVHVVDPSLALCEADGCPSGRGNEVWYRDVNHVTNTGANAAQEQFAPIFAGAIGRSRSKN